MVVQRRGGEAWLRIASSATARRQAIESAGLPPPAAAAVPSFLVHWALCDDGLLLFARVCSVLRSVLACLVVTGVWAACRCRAVCESERERALSVSLPFWNFRRLSHIPSLTTPPPILPTLLLPPPPLPLLPSPSPDASTLVPACRIASEP